MNRTPIGPNTLLFGDCMEWLRMIPDNTFTAVVSDPPYGLEFMGREWDAPWKDTGWQGGGGFSKPGIGDKCGCAAPQWKPIGKRRNPENEDLPDNMDGMDMARQMRGFQSWCEMWGREVLRVLKPGGHLLSFSGTRTYHRMTCGIEEAGFQIRDMVDFDCELTDYHAWMYGQGFPKSLNIGKAIDKAERGVPQGGEDPTSPNHGKFKGGCDENNPTGRGFGAGPGQFMKSDDELEDDSDLDDDKEQSDEFEPPIEDGEGFSAEATAWKGYGTALKPAHEPIAIFGKGAGCVPNHGVPFSYTPKVSTRERNLGCKNLFWKIVDGQQVPVTKKEYVTMRQENEDKKGKEGFQPYLLRRGNLWPTVKPIELMRYLVRMVKMPGENLILDPFMGSGTTPIACVLEGCNYVAIDRDPIAFRIAKARVIYFECLGKLGLKK